jgi:hypothetical protein
MLLRHISVLAGTLTGTLSLAGCADELGAAHDEIAWGSSDTGTDPIDQLKRDVVVHLPDLNCSGTLITPRLVVTTSSCVHGWAYGGTIHIGGSSTPRVVLGESVDQPRATIVAQRAATYIDEAVDLYSDYKVATDVALLTLPPSIPFVEDAISTKPGFFTPRSGGAGMAGYAHENLDDHGNRQVGWVPFEHNDVHDARSFETFGAAVRRGDMGGALFQTRSDGTRDLIGVLVRDDGDNVFDPDAHSSLSADITSDLMANWVRAMAQDTSRSDGWLRRHGVEKGNYWLGEVDYTGPCQRDRDVDCDHWYDEHDDCKLLSNIEQIETVDLGEDSPGYGVADLCRPAPPRPPQHCLVVDHCGWWIDFQCEESGKGDALNLVPSAAGQYQVCADNLMGHQCSKPLPVAYDKATCGCTECWTTTNCVIGDGSRLPTDGQADADRWCRDGGGRLETRSSCSCRE